jgi:hypothetical protein
MYEIFAQPYLPTELFRMDAFPAVIEQLGRKMQSAMTPAEKRAMAAATADPGRVTVGKLLDDLAYLRRSLEAMGPSRNNP